MTVRAVLGFRRWRRSPLYRPTDRHEAWLTMAALLLMVVAAPLLGRLCGSLTDDALQAAVESQRAQRHLTTAVVVRANRDGTSPFVQDSESVVREATTRTSVTAVWKAPDGTERSGTVSTTSETTAPGTRIRIWTDETGAPAMRPMDASTARTHAVLAGVGTALLAAGSVEVARRLVLWRMVRRRYLRIDRAWAETGPDWGRTGKGN
ncbi:Rv1733c family protein [Streptomyces halstedii]|uniref:Rv1733c family protein n=1 Tax=Streptomyces halstedii TaxID=1944 RepID=UPI0038201895